MLTSTAKADMARPLGPGEESYRAVFFGGRVAYVIARTFADAVRKAGELSGCPTGDDLESLAIDFGHGKAVRA
jgi:hypothetical protein